MTNYTNTYASRNITGQWRRVTQFFRKIYLSLNRVPFPVLLGCSTGGPLCWVLVFLYRIWSPTRLISKLLTSCLHPGYIRIWRPLFFLRVSQSHSFHTSTVNVIISWYSFTGCTCYLHRCISYFDNLAGLEVNMQKCPYERHGSICYSTSMDK